MIKIQHHEHLSNPQTHFIASLIQKCGHILPKTHKSSPLPPKNQLTTKHTKKENHYNFKKLYVLLRNHQTKEGKNKHTK